LSELGPNEGLITVKTGDVWTAEELERFIASVTTIYNSFLVLSPGQEDRRKYFLDDPISKGLLKNVDPKSPFAYSVATSAVRNFEAGLEQNYKLKIHKIKMGSDGGVIFRGEIDPAVLTQEVIAKAISKEPMSDDLLQSKMLKLARDKVQVENTMPTLVAAVNSGVQTIIHLAENKKIVGSKVDPSIFS
jgi:hypothetical protein